ncbi:MAG: glucokinase [bacterium]
MTSSDPPRASSRQEEPVLVGDVGGTRTRLALFERAGGALRSVHRETFDSADYEGLGEVVRRYLDLLESESIAPAPRRGCLALAAPRSDGHWHFPNLDWQVDSEALRDEIGLESLSLCNDFDAVAWSVEALEADDLVELQAGQPEEDGPRAFLGAGTGLGAAFSFRVAGQPRVVSSEGGHVDFAPRNEREIELLSFLLKRHEHVSAERVLSGNGLETIYRSLVARSPGEESKEVADRLVREEAPAVISELALNGKDPLCVEALDLFASVYGAQAGNLALLVQATGGVYIAGGIAPRILAKLRDGTFIRSFRAKGRVSGLLEKIPVSVITRENAGLLGAAVLALDRNPEAEPQSEAPR